MKDKLKCPGFVKDITIYQEVRSKQKTLFLLDKTTFKDFLKKEGFIIQDVFSMERNEKTNKWDIIDKGSFTGVVAFKKISVN